MNAADYKRFHESFMQNNNGSSAIHTYFSIFFTVLSTIVCSIGSKYSTKRQIVYEYLTILLPLILGHTLLAEYVYMLNVALAIILFFQCSKYWDKLNIVSTLESLNIHRNKKLQTITCIRGLTYLITVFCILAVDFRIFPRYLAKTERYGYSLMDTGVGLFVLSSGLVHKNLKNDKIATLLKNNLKLVIILISLGLSRFFLLKELEYQEHVTEYGVHWNFFYTLAVSKLFSALLLHILSPKYALLISVVIAAIHESILYYKAEAWVFSSLPRDTYLSANREGIASCLGYISMYFFAVYLKEILTDQFSIKYTVLQKLFLLSISLCSVSYFFNAFNPASRTLANVAYCSFIEAILTSICTVIYTFEVLFNSKYAKDNQFSIPLPIYYINDNGLVFFLIGNVMTGLVNLTMRTLLLETTISIAILHVHMVVAVGLTIYLSQKGIKI